MSIEYKKLQNYIDFLLKPFSRNLKTKQAKLLFIWQSFEMIQDQVCLSLNSYQAEQNKLPTFERLIVIFGQLILSILYCMIFGINDFME